MGAIIGIGFGVVALVLVFFLFSANGWTSRGKDRQESAKARAAEQATDPRADKRGTGVN